MDARVAGSLSDLPFILIHKFNGRGFMQYLIFGALVGVLGLLWAILALHDDPLKEGIRQAQAWSKSQDRLRKVMPE
jgi:sugar phosphate permease